MKTVEMMRFFDRRRWSDVCGVLVETKMRLSTSVKSLEVLDANRIQVTTSTGEEAIVNELVLTCPIPNVRYLIESSYAFRVLHDTVFACT